MQSPVHPGSTTAPPACQNPGLTHQTPINHRYVNGSSTTRQSRSLGAISIVATACLLTSTNSPNNIDAFPAPLQSRTFSSARNGKEASIAPSSPHPPQPPAQ